MYNTKDRELHLLLIGFDIALQANGDIANDIEVTTAKLAHEPLAKGVRLQIGIF